MESTGFANRSYCAEVAEVLPQIVKTNRDGIKLVDYAALSGFLVQVNKEQQLTLTNHENQLNQSCNCSMKREMIEESLKKDLWS